MSLFIELKRRNVFRVLLAYGIWHHGLADCADCRSGCDKLPGPCLGHEDDHHYADAGPVRCHVVALQNDNQGSAIATLLPDVEKSEVAGGSGYMIGSYYSQDYTGMICNQYRALGFFTIEIIHDSPKLA